ncbi:Glycoside Hydrolase Family 27 protein [Gigaspora rosea]|uniref:alpha-galactosidase n=1 Tax=Gigaspora rosea TaxID=44941 RepID=A0A397UUA8_9GLOM|nr:Glycoside Hydrolase Family 27 protein [Gigaspora rosea]
MHKNGLLFGIYSDAGTQTCGGFPGSLDYEDTDAQTFVDWDVDYLKYANCNEQGRPEQERYKLTKITDEAKALILNKDIISVNQDPLGLSVCQVYYKTDNKSSFDIWTGPLNDGYVAILFNRGIEPISITLDFKEHCHLNGSIEVYDLVKQQPYGDYTNKYVHILNKFDFYISY